MGNRGTLNEYTHKMIIKWINYVQKLFVKETAILLQAR